MVRAQHDYAAAGLYVLGVNGQDQELSLKRVQAFVREFSAPFDIALDQRGKVRSAYRIFGLPTTVFIDSSGVVWRVHAGPITGEELDKGIAEILPVR